MITGPVPAGGDDPARFTPIELVEVELTDHVPDLLAATSPSRRRVSVLVRLATEPLGYVDVEIGGADLSSVELSKLIVERFHGEIATRIGEAGPASLASLSNAGRPLEAGSTAYTRERERLLETAPSFSIVICTRDRAEQLRSCLIRLADQHYPQFEIVVVDNAPRTDDTRVVVEQARVDARYVREDRPGLSWARNAGVVAARADLIAFLDDDEEPDPYWLAELLRGFAASESIGCVSGMILPAALDTPAQEWFEGFGGHSKGRGFAPAIFGGESGQSPVYPLPPFGAGGNMAFRRAALTAIGGFDVALGAGTPARGGEDTYAFTRVLLAGFLMAYQPSAFVRHHHHDSFDGLSSQLHGYGVGLTAYYAALLRRDPRVVPRLLRLLPRAVRDLRGGETIAASSLPGVPPGVRRQRLLGMATGPLAYLRSVRTQAALTRRVR